MLLAADPDPESETEYRARALVPASSCCLVWPCPGAKQALACVPARLSRGFLPPSSSPTEPPSRLERTIEPLSRPIFLLLFPPSARLVNRIVSRPFDSSEIKPLLGHDSVGCVCSSFSHCVARFACPSTPIIAVVDAAIVAHPSATQMSPPQSVNPAEF